DSWPSQSAIVVASIPAASMRIAQVWRRMCGVRFLEVIVGQVRAAVAAWSLSRCATASVVIFLVVPRGVNTGMAAGPGFSASHALIAAVVVLSSGVILFFLPFPRLAMWAAGLPVWTSARVRAVSSETLTPVVIMRSIRRWSRRPVGVERSGLASSASISGVVR